MKTITLTRKDLEVGYKVIYTEDLPETLPKLLPSYDPSLHYIISLEETPHQFASITHIQNGVLHNPSGPGRTIFRDNGTVLELYYLEGKECSEKEWKWRVNLKKVLE